MNLTKEKHAFTPGPWYTYQSHKDVNRHIACKDGNSIAKEVHHANARLIAAAPEMYEMCKLFEECMETIDGKDGYDASYELAKVREVLAKVEGGEG
jgi:hypothetical protein